VLWTQITDAGLELLGKLDEIVERIPKELFQELTCDDVRELTRLLVKARCCEDRRTLAEGSIQAYKPDGPNHEQLTGHESPKPTLKLPLRQSLLRQHPE
jgi:hypothetical protein